MNLAVGYWDKNSPSKLKACDFCSLRSLSLRHMASIYVKLVFSVPDKLMEAELSQKLGNNFK